MRKTLLRIDILFLLTGLFLLLLCFFFSIRNSTVDITIHDTYLVIDTVTIGICLFALHSFYSLVYFLIRKHQKYGMGITHLILSLPLFGFLWKVLMSSFAMGGVPRRYYTNSDMEIFGQGSLLNFLMLVTIPFALGLLIFSINVAIALAKRVKS